VCRTKILVLIAVGACLIPPAVLAHQDGRTRVPCLGRGETFVGPDSALARAKFRPVKCDVSLDGSVEPRPGRLAVLRTIRWRSYTRTRAVATARSVFGNARHPEGIDPVAVTFFAPISRGACGLQFSRVRIKGPGYTHAGRMPYGGCRP
jgi:hypothetical protein